MIPSRELSSLGMMRWAEMPAAVLDQRLSSVLLEHITARLSVIDRAHRYVYANREVLEFLGRPASEVIGRHLSEVVGAAAYSGYQPLAARVFSGEALRLEGWVEYPGHGLRYLRETFIPYGPVDGEVEVVAVFGRDHTELKLREQELASRLDDLNTSEALKTAIVDHALAALVTTDELGRIVEFNPAAEAMFGRARSAVMGQPVSEVMMPERFRGPHEAGMRRLQAGGAPRVMGKRLEMYALRADGAEFPMEMVLWRTDAHGHVFYTASIADLSERHAAAAQIARQREALRQSEKLTAMGSLLAGVAHELNNPLAIVMGRASLLEEKCEAQPELRADAQRVREAAERCGRIVRTFLNMARSRPTTRSLVALNEMVRAAVDMLQYGYRTHGIDLELSLAEALPQVNVDGDQIGQVVMNLLVNAQQALAGTQGARRVLVETGMEPARANCEPRVWLRVSDNGPGVESDARDRVFEPFFTTKPDGVGTGLGLAVSRTVARDHGGELTLESASPQGASFRLSLPISGIASAETAPGAPPESGASLQARILVVDDEAELADVMRQMLENAGYEVATAESGAVALELLATARFDAVISDLRMPDMDGAGLWREVSARHPLLAHRILFVTGDTLSPDAREFLRAARCDSLDKPFSKADLLARVSDLLR
ncbi:PAS domain-containing hybrid sensor histidine kinase/response regulator [Variovorax sp. GT1P44]|uniref:PAS domain-containing hybrid sensor histidine kinase/response regulator n=1 Tax=Variovorax sp. GT1P44 TaxID=3443742 RepID=UPI003F470013